jgi:hypothetical protein
MSPIAHKKKKERLALALRIERANHEVLSCSHYRTLSRHCLIDRLESLRYSECVRAKRPCDSPSPLVPPVPRRVVYRFFYSPKRPSSTRVFSLPSTPWFPAFELDTFLSDLVGISESFINDSPESGLYRIPLEAAFDFLAPLSLLLWEFLDITSGTAAGDPRS